MQVHFVILPAGGRAAEVPVDTAGVPLEAWLKGWAQEDAAPGEELAVETVTGRIVKGVLTEVDPGYEHTYGPSVPELAPIGKELRAMLKEAASRG